MKQLDLFGFEDVTINEEDKKYSLKVKTPIYTPSGRKVSIYECYDPLKYKRLVRRINNSNISEEDKEFLRMAATRHIVFNYERIADYYANSSKEMLELVGLSDHLDKKPRQLSGGQQQRVAIARTLALNPDVILFDEPMSALDVDTRLSLRAELKELQKRFGTTMIYITHDQEEAFALSDRIMVMDAGVIHQLDTPHNIINHPADEYVKRFVIKNIDIKINSLIQFARSEENQA